VTDHSSRVTAFFLSLQLKAVLASSVTRFLLVGVINTAVGLSVIFSVQLLTDLGAVWANIIGYAVGLTVSFFLNKRWTFRFNGGIIGPVLRFSVVFLVAYCANLSAVLGLERWTAIGPLWSQALGTVPYSVFFYLGSRLYAFPPHRSLT
jgi:putative flippase GtrA